MRTLCLLILTFPLFAQNNANLLTTDEFVKDWTISKQFTIDVAEKMPENKYSFKATEAEMSFRDLMIHIAASHSYRFYQISGIKLPAWVASPPKDPSKADVIRMLAESFDYVIAAIPKITPDQMDKTFKVGWKGRPEATGRAMMLNMFVHVAHHRAQAEVYLRLNGIEPPIYTF
jgi:uncharacterized damage-inducible protein DinB